MIVGITLELEDGQKARIQFAETVEGGAHVVCEASRGCVHNLTSEHIALIFQAIGVPQASSPLDSVRSIVATGKADELFQALHTSQALLDNPQFLVLPVPWDEAALAELLELYLAGFTLEMLSRHFEMTVTSIVRKLAEVVWGEEKLTQDCTKALFEMGGR